jgi:hypothetical protein
MHGGKGMLYERMEKNINFTNTAKKMSPVSMMPMSCACFEGREGGKQILEN